MTCQARAVDVCAPGGAETEGSSVVTQAEDEAEVRRLDSAWNEAYLRNDRSRLADVLADDFAALMPSGDPVSKAALMVNPPPAISAAFSEQAVLVFGDTAISRGRLQLELTDGRVDQRFLRVFSRRGGVWRAVSVAVSPVPG
jgi:ketosteroid isomerase-like protein